MGKVTVVKTFAIPKLIYPLTALINPPPEIVNNIFSRKFFKFIWDGKSDKIKRSVMYKNGGLRLTNLNW